MHRIDCPTATPDNRFTEGDPTIPIAATTVTADWLNAVQEELAAVILGADMALDKTKHTQLLEAIKSIVAGRTPFATTERAGLVRIGGGLTITEEGLLSAIVAPIATLTQAGIIKPDGSTIAIKPDGTIGALGGALLYNRRLVIEESGDFVARATGWHRITCIGGGGAGGSQSTIREGDGCGG